MAMEALIKRNRDKEKKAAAETPVALSNSHSEDPRLSLRMSKLTRTLQTTAAESNWADMAKILFRADANAGRHDYIKHFLLFERLNSAKPVHASYSTEQFQSVLLLLIIISVAEKKTHELYESEFSARCDEIARKHGLKDDQKWMKENSPSEFEDLNHEFEYRSSKILVETLQDYGQSSIAKVVQTTGSDRFFELVKNLRSQFLKILYDFEPEAGSPSELTQGSIPESLQS